MTVTKERAMQMFDQDLSNFMDEMRDLLVHYSIPDWEAYIFFRKPECPGSYVLKYEATAGDGFAKRIVALHSNTASDSARRAAEARNREKAQEIVVATEAALGEKFDSIARHELVNRITIALNVAATPAADEAGKE